MRRRGHTHHAHGPTRFAAIPARLQLRADAGVTGRGVTIAVIDAGFRAHPDLEGPPRRVLAYRDCAAPRAALPARGEAAPWEWHGTQTAVVAAGDGTLSGGVYSSLAPDAKVVLVKVGERGRITDAAIAEGLRWIVRRRERFGIRIATISVGGDRREGPESGVAVEAAEEAVRAGIVVVAAAGNDGGAGAASLRAPASAPSVITVGGTDDGNRLVPPAPDLYHSSFGTARGGIAKPELVAPARFVAAPILEGTPLARQAIALTRLAAAPDYLLPALASDLAEEAGLSRAASGGGMEAIRAEVEARLRVQAIASAHYQHVEGTSFAAPLVASIAAQMLEADPGLDPAEVKRVLMATARRLPGLPAERQGFGSVDAAAAVAAARRAAS